MSARPTLEHVIEMLLPALPKEGGEWTTNISKMSSPVEAWLSNEKYQVGLFDEEKSVLVVVWVGSGMRSLGVDSEEKLAHLLEWIGPNLDAQAKTGARLADEEKKRAAIKPPSVEEVIAVLKTGKHIQIGAGRWYITYLWKDDKLVREIFDEGNVDQEDATEDQLRDDMASNGAQVREQM